MPGGCTAPGPCSRRLQRVAVTSVTPAGIPGHVLGLQGSLGCLISRGAMSQLRSKISAVVVAEVSCEL